MIKGSTPKDTLFAKGGPKTPNTSMQWGKGQSKANPKPKDKSITPIKPKK